VAEVGCLASRPLNHTQPLRLKRSLAFAENLPSRFHLLHVAAVHVAAVHVAAVDVAAVDVARVHF